ncbi:MAG: type sorting protein, partial [Daejeonella sp.]|nr:type sorting protein [Daejeonella sp.]
KNLMNILLAGSMLYLVSCKKPEQVTLKPASVSEVADEPSSPGIWTKKAKFPVGKKAEHPLPFTINNKIYLQIPSLVDDFWEYDPSQDLWTKKKSYGAHRTFMAAFSVGGYGYAGLGMNLIYDIPEFKRYSPLTDSWSEVADFPGELGTNTMGFSVGNRGYILSASSDGGNTIVSV